MSNPYYTHPAVSNSALTKLKRELSGQDQQEYPDAFRIGTLVDVMITQPAELDLITRTIGSYQYTQDEIDNARSMRKAFMADPFCAQLHRLAEPQKPFYSTLQFAAVVPFGLDCKCLYDIWHGLSHFGADIKTTVARTQSQFEDAFMHFDYDRSRYWYMRNSQSTRDVVIGISKHNHKIFKIFITTNDARYLSGEAKAVDLAFKYWSLKGEVV